MTRELEAPTFLNRVAGVPNRVAGAWILRAVSAAVLLVPAGWLGGAPGALHAQEVEVRAVPSAGWFVPTSRLYRSDLPPARAELQGGGVLGLGLHALQEGLPVSLRVTAERTVGLETRVTGQNPLIGQPEEAWPTHEYVVPSRITTVTGDLLVHPGRGELGSSAYVFVGLGWKSYRFGQEEPPDEVGFKFPEDGTSGRVHYGAGLEVPVAGVRVAGEAGGNFNRFVLVDEEQGLSRSDAQHEFIFSLKVFFGVFSF